MDPDQKQLVDEQFGNIAYAEKLARGETEPGGDDVEKVDWNNVYNQRFVRELYDRDDLHERYRKLRKAAALLSETTDYAKVAFEIEKKLQCWRQQSCHNTRNMLAYKTLADADKDAVLLAYHVSDRDACQLAICMGPTGMKMVMALINSAVNDPHFDEESYAASEPSEQNPAEICFEAKRYIVNNIVQAELEQRRDYAIVDPVVANAVVKLTAAARARPAVQCPSPAAGGTDSDGTASD